MPSRAEHVDFFYRGNHSGLKAPIKFHASVYTPLPTLIVRPLGQFWIKKLKKGKPVGGKRH
jgi:hypothetical protein